MLDVELGVEFSGDSSDGGFVPMARVGIVGQNWFGAGNDNLGFFGLSVMVGGEF